MKEPKTSPEYYAKAPIILAILQIRYKMDGELNHKIIRTVGEELKKEFPNVNERVVQTLRIDGAGKPEETKVSLDDKIINGVQFRSEDNKRVLVVGVDTFTCEIHSDYPGWESIKSTFKNLWNTFSPKLKMEITGVSMRFVNKINLPNELIDLSSYFTTFINSSSGDHNINQFQLRYSGVKNNIIYHVGHAVEPVISDQMPYLFDIDVIYLGEITNDENSVWGKFEELRNLKNDIFNDTLTEKTKKTIR